MTVERSIVLTWKVEVGKETGAHFLSAMVGDTKQFAVPHEKCPLFCHICDEAGKKATVEDFDAKYMTTNAPPGVFLCRGVTIGNAEIVNYKRDGWSFDLADFQLRGLLRSERPPWMSIYDGPYKLGNGLRVGLKLQYTGGAIFGKATGETFELRVVISGPPLDMTLVRNRAAALT